MELESKFIEGTNNQYSIRNDGVVIQHFKKQRITNTRTDIIYTNKEMKIYKGSAVQVIIEGVNIRLAIRKLTLTYFGFVFCDLCNNKFVPNISSVKCDNCRKKSRKTSSESYYNNNKETISKTSYTWRENNKEIANEITKRYRERNPDKIKAGVEKRIKNLSKNYIASTLRLPINLLTEEMYEDQKSIIRVKRLLSQKLNCSINSIK